MIIKKLTKDELAEGITLQIVNSIDMSNNFSPVQLQKGVEPVKLLKCLNGYNAIYDDPKFMRDENNKVIVYRERECKVGRARFLLNFAEQEKAEKTKELIETWKFQIRKTLDEVKSRIISLESGSFKFLLEAAMLTKEDFDKYREDMSKELQEIKPAYEQAEKLFSENRLAELVNSLGIAKLTNPILSVAHDDKEGWRVLKNVFGAKALKEWDGDTLNRYARIEVEKQYAKIPL